MFDIKDFECRECGYIGDILFEVLDEHLVPDSVICPRCEKEYTMKPHRTPEGHLEVDFI